MGTIPNLRLVTPESVTEPEIPAAELPLSFEVYFEGKPTGVKGESYSDTLELAVSLMRTNLKWDCVKVLEDGKVMRGGVWRNSKEGRLIKSKELG